MSESEKTEQPTEKRLRDAKEKGQVAYSRDATTTIMVIAAFAVMLTNDHFFIHHLRAMFATIGSLYHLPFIDAVSVGGYAMLIHGIAMLMPFLLIILVAGLVFGFIQIGPILAFKALKPDMKKLNPVSNLKNMFGKKKMLELLMNLIKITAIAIVVWMVVRSSIKDLLYAPQCGTDCIGEVLKSTVQTLIIFTAMTFIVLAAVDVLIKRKMLIKDLMMTKDEVKREFKESEGDPLIKSKRRQLFQEIAMNNVADKVRQSSIVVSNPTHIAVAMRYHKGETPLPIVTVKGQDMMAAFILNIAKKSHIPVMENVPLAHALHDKADIDRYIPSDMIESVAAVFRWLDDLRRGPE